MSWGDDKNGKGDVFSPVSWDAATTSESNWAFSATSSNESSAFFASARDSPSKTNYFSPVEITPLYGSVESNRSSFFSSNNESCWAFKSSENGEASRSSFAFGDSFGFKADQDISYLESNQSKVFDVFSNTASELENYHAARSMKENRAANSWFSAPSSTESSSWAFSKDETAETSSFFTATQTAETNSWAFSREDSSKADSVFKPSSSAEQSSWAFARPEQSGNSVFAPNEEKSTLSSWAFGLVEQSAGDFSSPIFNPFSTKK